MDRGSNNQDSLICCEDFLKTIEDIDLQKEEIGEVYQELKKRFAPIAKQLHLARSQVTINVPPIFFAPDGETRSFALVYDENSGPDGHAITLDHYIVLDARGTARMWPVGDHVWTAAEERTVRVMSKFIFMMVSRSVLLKIMGMLSYIDMFTGLANVKGLHRFMDQIEAQGRLQEYAMCFFNLKNFKYFNQRYGSNGGDYLLKQYSLELYRFINHEEEIVVRPGGDNFIILLKKERLADFLEFTRQVTILLQTDGKTIPVPISGRFGVYSGTERDTKESMFQNVSIALSRAKEEKKDVEYFTGEMLERMMEGQKIAASFPMAMYRGEIFPYYQPKVEINTKKLCGAEALARWKKNGKLLNPGLFLPALDHAGEIHNLDIYMLELVCKDIRSWIDSGLEPVRISVNFDKSDLMVPTIVQDTLAILNKYGLDGSHIEIELTELSSYDNIERLGQFINELHQHQIMVTMDDFGSGYSSLNFLKDTDFNIVKLDKSFVDHLENHVAKDEVMLRGMVSMLSGIGVEVVAEGVETKEQATFVRDLNCDVIQGYYYDRPMPADEFVKRLKTRVYD